MISLQKELNRYRKLLIRVKTKKEDIAFLQKCERNKIFPRFIEKGFRVRNSSLGACKAVEKGKLIWLKFEIKSHYGQLHRDRNELYHLQLYLCKNSTQYEWQSFLREVERVAVFKVIKKRRTLKRKFTSLKYSKGWRSDFVGANEPRNFPFVVNKSSQDFSYDQLALLNNGLKFRPAPQKIPLDEVVVKFESSIERCREVSKQWAREEVKPLIVQREKATAKQWKLIKELKEKNVVYSHPDKGKGVVILDKEDYVNAVMTHISEGPYELQKFRAAFPVDRLQKQVKEGLDKLCSEGLISDDQRRRLIVSNPRMPRMSGLPKIHKSGNQIRPVVTTIDSPTSKIAHLLVKKFRTYKKFDSCSVRNSIDLVKILSEVEIEDDYEMVSYDVKALFPSIPESEAVVMLKEWCSEQDTSDKEVAVVCGLIDIVVSQKFFQFGDKIYKQLDGVEIGGKISPWLAEITMSRLEMKLLSQPQPPLQLFRFVDDYFAIIKNDTAEKLLNRLNDMHPNIKFTFEREEEGRIPFLDLMIIRKDKKLTFEIYRKPTDSMLCIPACSSTPDAYKMASFHTMFNRLYNIPLDNQAFKKEEEYIFEVCDMNGYDRKMIKKIQQKHLQKNNQPKSTLKRENSNDRQEGGRLLMMNFYPPLTDHIQRVAKRVHINSVYTSKGTLGDFLINLKDERPSEAKSGIYRIKCQQCDDEYYGQTRRRAQERWKEHDAACRLNQPQKSAVAKHALSFGHSIGEKKLVKEVTSPWELNAWESYFIETSNADMNEGEAPIRSSLFYLAHNNN
jgi:hypothetical protein